MSDQDIGLIGLGVMGTNLIRNIESRGYSCSVYNRNFEVTENFIQEESGKNFYGTRTLEDFVQSLRHPRRILVMITAGKPVDTVIDSLLPLLTKGDIIADLGNSFYPETTRRNLECANAGVHFLGVGVSGGEEGALIGPSIMPGGSKAAWELLAPIFDKIAAKAPDPCHTYIGPEGSGHFVKMIHNGIEYGDMQLIAETYNILSSILELDNNKMAEIFSTWNTGVLSSFLIEITAEILAEKDSNGNDFLLDNILDNAAQKGTGRWTAQSALQLGVAAPTLSSAVDARYLSTLKSQRVRASQTLHAGLRTYKLSDKNHLIQATHDALFCSKIVSYAQGMAIMEAASAEYDWNLNLSAIARIWRGGCIIRAQFLNNISDAYTQDPELPNLLLDSYIQEQIKQRLSNWREILALSINYGIPSLGLSSALSYYDSYRSKRLPQNLTQAQRDYFGAHQFERIDQSSKGSKLLFHHQWHQSSRGKGNVR